MNIRRSCLVAAVALLCVTSISAQENGSLEITDSSSIDLTLTQRAALAELQAGARCLSVKDYENAQAHYERAIASQPKLAEAYYNLGVLFVDTHKFAEAVKALEEAIRLKPTLPRVHFYLGFAYSQLRQSRRAAEQYELAKLVAPSADVLNNLGFAYLDLKRFEDAEKAFQQALQLKPDYPASMGGLCMVESTLSRPGEAVELCRRAAVSNASSVNIQFLLGAAYLELGEYRRALEPLETAWALRPNEPYILDAIGVTHWRMHQYDDALANFLAASKARPDSAEAYAGMGASYYMLNKFSEAQQAFHQAIALNPESSAVHFNLAVTCLHEKARSCALEQYNVLKTLSPDLSDKLFGNLFANRVVDARRVSQRR